MDSPVVDKIQRIYAALGQTVTGDLATVPALIEEKADGLAVWQDFTGGLNQAQLSNLLHSLIHNIVNLRDHARKECKAQGIDPSSTDNVSKEEAFLVLTDLSNNDKHGYPPRDGGRTGKSPQILKVDRILRMTTSSEAGSASTLVFGSDGFELSGKGDARVIITADVLKADGVKMGDAHEICVTALDHWEGRLRELGLI